MEHEYCLQCLANKYQVIFSINWAFMDFTWCHRLRECLMLEEDSEQYYRMLLGLISMVKGNISQAEGRFDGYALGMPKNFTDYLRLLTWHTDVLEKVISTRWPGLVGQDVSIEAWTDFISAKASTGGMDDVVGRPPDRQPPDFVAAEFIPPVIDLTLDDDGPDNSLKHPNSDMASGERPSKLGRIESETPLQLPAPEAMPPLQDDGGRPPYSYSQMVGMAILRAPNRRLTISQIYDWIATTFAFYKENYKQDWRNSLRRAISMSKALQKIENPNREGGKGSHWVVRPGREWAFLDGKSVKTQAGNTDRTLKAHGPPTRADERPDRVDLNSPRADSAPSGVSYDIDDVRKGNSKDTGLDEEPLATKPTNDRPFDLEALFKASARESAAIDKF